MQAPASSPLVVYSPGYDYAFFGIERLHPFDARRASRAWAQVPGIAARTVEPGEVAGDDALTLVHDPAYLASLRRPVVLAKALELAPLAYLPVPWLGGRLLKPMRRAVAGTLRAAEIALEFGVAMNLSGGYHHAGPDRGEGFCVFNDIAYAIARLRQAGRLTETDRVLYIDLDAHQGNGVARCFAEDRRVTIVDAYNEAIYPDDRTARARIDHPVPLPPYTTDDGYLPRIESALTRALNDFDGYALAFYNAGTDIHEADLLGHLAVSADGVRQRDRFVIDALRTRGIPTLALPSGGYGPMSFQLVADLLTLLAR